MSPASDPSALGAVSPSACRRHAPANPVVSRRARHGLVALAVLAVAALAGAARAVELSIDEFSAPSSGSYQSNAGAQLPWTNSGLSVGDTLGGVRDGSIGCEYYDNVSAVKATLNGSTLAIDSTGNSTPSLYLSYDGNSGWPAGTREHQPFNGIFASPVNLSTYSHIVFRFSYVAGWGGNANPGFIDFRITVVEGASGAPGDVDYDSLGRPADSPAYPNVATTWYSRDLASSINAQLTDSSSAQDFYFPLSALVNKNGVQATLTAVQALQIHACSSDTGLDYTLDYIRATTVPEPSTALLALGVTLGLALRRRPRRCRAA